MAAVNRRRRLLACYLLLRDILRRRREREHRRKHRFWVRPIFQRRERLGIFHTLVQEMEDEEREYYYKYVEILTTISYFLTLD